MIGYTFFYRRNLSFPCSLISLLQIRFFARFPPRFREHFFYTDFYIGLDGLARGFYYRTIFLLFFHVLVLTFYRCRAPIFRCPCAAPFIAFLISRFNIPRCFSTSLHSSLLSWRPFLFQCPRILYFCNFNLSCPGPLHLLYRSSYSFSFVSLSAAFSKWNSFPVPAILPGIAPSSDRIVSSRVRNFSNSRFRRI